jgi:predicted nucleotidyltransferase
MVQFSDEINNLLDFLLAGIKNLLHSNLVGIYLRGSLAMGDFNPDTSDLDVLAVTEIPVDESTYAGLLSLHNAIDHLPNRYARRLEMAYVDRRAIRRFQPGFRHPTLGQGEKLDWTEHHENWILERWVIRNYGITLFGPPPASLIDPISSDEIRSAVRLRLADWVEWALTPDDPEWLLPRSHKAYAVETMCRALHTLATGEVISKPLAVEWALKSLPEPWRTTVQHSQSWRTDQTNDPSIAAQVRDFILWAAS